MKPENKKYVVAGAIAFLSTTCALAYIQYKKIMEYVIKTKGVKIKAISPTLINFDLIINLTNKANIGYKILSQKYKVYINDTFISELTSNTTANVPANGNTDMAINVNIDPTSVIKVAKTSYANLLLKPEIVKVKIDGELVVRFLGIFKPSIKFTHETNLKEIVASKS